MPGSGRSSGQHSAHQRQRADLRCEGPRNARHRRQDRQVARRRRDRFARDEARAARERGGEERGFDGELLEAQHDRAGTRQCVLAGLQLLDLDDQPGVEDLAFRVDDACSGRPIGVVAEAHGATRAGFDHDGVIPGDQPRDDIGSQSDPGLA